MNKPRGYRSPVLDRIMREMAHDSWQVKLRRWWRVKLWTWMCLTRKYWDKEYQHYIFKKKQSILNTFEETFKKFKL